MTDRRGGRRSPDRLRDPQTGEWDMDEVRHRSKGWVAVVVALTVLIGGTWFAGAKAWDAWMGFRAKDDYVGAGVADIDVSIPSGATPTQIGRILQEADVVKSADTFRGVAQTRPDQSARIQAGTYKMRTQIPASEAFDRLTNPANIVRNLMRIGEGLRASETLATMSEVTGIPVAELEEAAKDPAKLGVPAWGHANVEGFLYPDTYEVGSKPTAQGVLKAPVDNFNKVARDLDFEDAAKASPAADPYKALVVASIVEREAHRPEDRLRVARVFYNRIAKGMALQSDATVTYVTGKFGNVFTSTEDRQINSPYNTYLPANAGKLPPTPITSPTRTSLDAAVHPAEGDWLYFVTVNLDTGETDFNATLEEHNRSIKKLQDFCQTSDKC